MAHESDDTFEEGEGDEWKQAADDATHPNHSAASVHLGLPVRSANINRDKMCERITARYGIDRDELDTLYPKDDDLVDYYHNVLLKSKEMVGEEDDPAAPADDYKFTEANQADLDVLKDDGERSLRAANAQQKQAAKAGHAALNATLPPAAQVSWEEQQAAMRDAMKLDDLGGGSEAPKDGTQNETPQE